MDKLNNLIYIINGYRTVALFKGFFINPTEKKVIMEAKLANICETYIKNRDEMRRILRSSGIAMHLMGAAVLTAFEKNADEDKILQAEKLLKEKEAEDSPIRGSIKSVTTVHMMLADSIESYYDDLKRTHDLIQVNRGGDDERYYMAAMMMSDKISDMQDILFLLDRAGLIHEGMGKTFSSLEDKSGYVTASFAAACGVVNTKAFLERVIKCEEYFKESGIFETVPESFSMLLAIQGNDIEPACKKAIELFEAFRAKNMEFERDEEAGMVAILTALDMPTDEIVNAVYDADEFLKEHSGFTEGRGCILRHVYAAMLVTLAYAPDRGVEWLKKKIESDSEVLKRMVLMQSQSVMHIQMEYVDVEDLHI